MSGTTAARFPVPCTRPFAKQFARTAIAMFSAGQALAMNRDPTTAVEQPGSDAFADDSAHGSSPSRRATWHPYGGPRYRSAPVGRARRERSHETLASVP